MSRRNHTRLHAVLSISTVLLMIWGIDLSRSVAYEQSAGPYRAEVNIWVDGPFFDLLQNALAANRHDESNCAIVVRSDGGLLSWEHNTHPDSIPGSKNDGQIHLIRLSRESDGSRVMRITFTASGSTVEGPGSGVVLIHETLTGQSSHHQTPPTRIDTPITYPFGG